MTLGPLVASLSQFTYSSQEWWPLSRMLIIHSLANFLMVLPVFNYVVMEWYYKPTNRATNKKSSKDDALALLGAI